MNNINKKDLINAIAEKTKDISKKNIEASLNALMESVIGFVKKGDKVTLVGFGSFQPVDRKATEKRNPKTGATIKVPKKRVMKFKTSKALNDTL